jgi:hypothetical protein
MHIRIAPIRTRCCHHINFISGVVRKQRARTTSGDRYVRCPGAPGIKWVGYRHIFCSLSCIEIDAIGIGGKISGMILIAFSSTLHGTPAVADFPSRRSFFFSLGPHQTARIAAH